MRVVPQGAVGVCVVPNKHSGSLRQGLYFIHCVPLQGACCSQDMLTVHFQSSEGLLSQALVAPTMMTNIMRPLAVDSILSPPLPQLTPRAGAFTVSILKMKKQSSESADF